MRTILLIALLALLMIPAAAAQPDIVGTARDLVVNTWESYEPCFLMTAQPIEHPTDLVWMAANIALCIATQ